LQVFEDCIFASKTGSVTIQIIASFVLTSEIISQSKTDHFAKFDCCTKCNAREAEVV